MIKDICAIVGMICVVTWIYQAIVWAVNKWIRNTVK